MAQGVSDGGEAYLLLSDYLRGDSDAPLRLGPLQAGRSVASGRSLPGPAEAADSRRRPPGGRSAVGDGRQRVSPPAGRGTPASRPPRRSPGPFRQSLGALGQRAAGDLPCVEFGPGIGLRPFRGRGAPGVGRSRRQRLGRSGRVDRVRPRPGCALGSAGDGRPGNADALPAARPAGQRRSAGRHRLAEGFRHGSGTPRTAQIARNGRTCPTG